MSRSSDKEQVENMREEYDFSSGVRCKYYQRYKEGTNVVLLDPDVAEVFRDSESVNRALRELINIARNETSLTR